MNPALVFRVVAALLVAAATVVAAPADNLLPNPSFEEVTGDRPTGWDRSVWAGAVELTVDENGRTGKWCVRVFSKDGADAGWSVRVPVEPSARYRLSGWIRTANVKPTTGRGAFFNVHGLDGPIPGPIVGDTEWQRLETEFDTGDRDEAQINYMLGGWGVASGTVWFDDVSLELVSKRETPPPRIVIDASQVGPPISKYIYGQFIEHLGRCIYGGIWAEMLEDRKFFHVIGRGESPWKAIGGFDGVAMAADGAFSGAHSPRITLAPAGRARGVVQSGLALRKGREYTGRIWLAGGADAGPVQVSLVWGEKPADRQTIAVERLSSEYSLTPLKFAAAGDTDDGKLEIVGLGEGTFRIGAVSLMPADNVEGFRADTLALLKELNSPIYRWPGGNFVSGYDWRDGVGERDRRPTRRNPAWKGIDTNDVGIHEFMQLCRLLGTDPYIVVNAGLGDATSAAEEVEYVNGDAKTPMGQLRDSHGPTEPYGVKIWGIGNEMYGDWQLGHMPLEEYVRKHNHFAAAMRKVDPAIEIVGVGAVGPWSETMLAQCGPNMDWLSEHFYCQERPGILAHMRQVPDSIRRIAEAHRSYRRALPAMKDRTIPVALDEWNYWSGPEIFGELGTRYFMKDALGIAAGLHEYGRCSDVFTMANYAQTVNVIGCIKTRPTSAALETTGLVLKLYREQFGVLPLKTETGTPLDALAALSEDRMALTLGIVNASRTALEIPVEIRGVTAAGAGTRWEIAHDDPMAFNDPDDPKKIVIRESTIEGALESVHVAPCSVTLIRVRLQ